MKHIGIIFLVLSIASLTACRDERGDPQVVLNEDKPVAIQPPADAKANEEGLPVELRPFISQVFFVFIKFDQKINYEINAES